MKKKIKKYNDEEINFLCKAMTHDEESFMWLYDHDCKELTALVDYLVYGNEEAYDWLKLYDYKIQLAFISALEGSEEAYEYLGESKSKEWAAAIDAMNLDEGAQEWLLNFKYKIFLKLASVMREKLNVKNGNSAMGNFSGGTNFGGGASFGGFGGGSFSGGGAVGGW